MLHLTSLDLFDNPVVEKKSLIRRAAGRFYTPHWMARELATQLVARLPKKRRYRALDPFSGDGRLLVAVVQSIGESEVLSSCTWEFHLWDNDGVALADALINVRSALSKSGVSGDVFIDQRDTFLDTKERGVFDMVITNPPWEALKPDSRELQQMTRIARVDYETQLRAYDQRLKRVLPYSQPSTKTYGWGTNLSRCGLELSINLCSSDGVLGVILPSSILADEASSRLRRWLLDTVNLVQVDHYPAEARPFDSVDQPCVSIQLTRPATKRFAPLVVRHDGNRRITSSGQLALTRADLATLNYRLPVELDQSEADVLIGFQSLPLLQDFDVSRGGKLWMGRELDETGYKTFVADRGDVAFMKGRHVDRFKHTESGQYVVPGARIIPESHRHARVAWRDVSRRSQARRVIASLIPPGVVTGNSLQVAYYMDGDVSRTKTLLGVISSMVFEFQLRNRLGTGHVSLGTVRSVNVPDLNDRAFVKRTVSIVDRLLNGEAQAEVDLDVLMVMAYGLSASEYSGISNTFSGVSGDYKAAVLCGLQRAK
jgi:Alw26I/Eco31I/Esp3I family type II restriction m6 adenine DNA methyltransferase